MKFECPHCHSRLSAEAEHYGRTVICPECSQPISVPKPPSAEPQGAGSQEIVKFLCPHCNRRLSAVSHQFGKEMPCPHPDCLKPVLVPRPEWKPIPTVILQKGNANVDDLLRQAREMTRKKPE